MTVKSLFPFLLGLSLFSACVRTLPPPVEIHVQEEELPEAYRASTGGIAYDEAAYSWVETKKGPLELNHSWVRNGVITDESLTAICSDVGGVCVGENAWISSSFVRGGARIEGTAHIYESEVSGPVHVGEELIACGAKFKADVQVEGNITAQDSCFEGALTATADIVCLTNTKTGALCIKDCGPYWDKQIIRIRNGSVVAGDITFESGRGRVMIDDSSRFIGTLCGGRFLEPCKEYGVEEYSHSE